jgi:hypothetical protein
MFKYQGNRIINIQNKKYVTITGTRKNADVENRNVGLSTNSNDAWLSQWDIVYVKNMPADLKKGQWNRDFRFKVGVDFYIVSRMGQGRYLSVINNYDVVIKRSYSSNSQKWYFDNNTKTIRNRKHGSYSLEIKNSGSANNARFYTTNSRWW